MHEQLPDYKSSVALKRFVIKYVRTLHNLRRTGRRAAHQLDEQPPPLEVEEQEPEEEEVMARLSAVDDVKEQIEILAVVRQSGFRPSTRGQGGQRRLAPRNGPPAPRSGAAACFGAPPHGTARISKATRHPNADSQRWK